MEAIRPERYKGVAINPYYLKNQEKRGIHAEWYTGEFSSAHQIEIEGFDAKAEHAPQDKQEERLQIVSIKPQKWNRKANSIIAYLDRITLYSRVKKDDLSVMELMDGFTLAQITDFINIANENNANNVLASLIEYKNDRFSDYDPMDSYLLE